MDKTKKRFLGIGVLAAIAVITFAFAIAASGSDGGVIDQNAEGVTVAASAVTTSSINYQGKLTDSAGEPLSGTYTMTFRLYEVASGGTALDTDSHSVEVTDGLLNTDIGFDQEYFDGRALWVGITVGIDPEMSPRQEFKPVPYALSLRPGAVINKLVAKTSDDYSYGVSVDTSGEYGFGVLANTSGDNSPGVWAFTTGNNSWGVWAFTMGLNSSFGVLASTMGDNSDAIGANTLGDHSPGVRAETYGDDSDGFRTKTYGNASYGFCADTYGKYGRGFDVDTHGDDSNGISIDTFGDNSAGVSAWTHGDSSPCVFAVTSGDDSQGVLAGSDKSDAIYADTERSDHKYGVRTPDKMCAMSYDTDSSDIAEYFPVTEDPEPCTVMVIDPTGGCRLRASTKAYDTTVAGIVSTAPGVALGTNESGNEGEQLIAIAGRVPCKVDASYASVKPGDLLTTSDTLGHAMKATNPEIGTILGKALEPLDSGTGVIEVLVTLQ